MSRADKPATKPTEAIAHPLTPTESYQLNPLQREYEDALVRFNRANHQLRALAIGVLERSGETHTDPDGWRFDVRDDGLFLVRGDA